MALRGWRLIGVAGTIFAYVAGILFLSLVSIQSPQQRRLRGFGGGGGSNNGAVGRSVSEVDLLRTRELGLLGRRQPLQWCRLLRYMDSDHPFKGWPIIGKNKMLQTFPGHYINKQDNYMLKGSNSILINRSSISSSSSSSSSSSTSINNEKLKNNNNNRPNAIDSSSSLIITTSATLLKNNNNYYYLNNNKNNYNNNEIKINYEPIWPQIKHRSSSLTWRSTDNNNNNINNNDNDNDNNIKLGELNTINENQDIGKKATIAKILVNNRDNNNLNSRNSKNKKPKKTLNNDKGNQNDGSSNNAMNGLTALASFPGSGNTWLRYLLQQATGILTGSIYKDYGLLKSGFPAENVCNKSVLIIKTHEWGPQAWSRFTKAVLLIRDPDKAILAEFNRQSGGHVGFASPDRYKRTKGRYWQHFVTNKLWAWEQMNLAWAKNFTGDIKIIFYDDLVGDVETVLRAILEFINFTIDEDLLTCALQRREGIYRRKRRILSFDPYSSAMHKIMNDKRDEVYAALGRVNP